MVILSTIYFKTQINNIRKEALQLGFSEKTVDGYLSIWKSFIKWKDIDDFIYSSDEYDKFLLENYNFDVNSFTNKSKSYFQQLIRSKRMLDDWDSYKTFMTKKMFPINLYYNIPNEWISIIDNFVKYEKDVRQNSEGSISIKKSYLKKGLSYFYQNGLSSLKDLSNSHINKYITDTVNAGIISKRRNFYVLREFLKYLFIENILNEDLSIYIPSVRAKGRRKLPTYLKQQDIEKLLSSIPRNKINEKRDYAIILIAARLGLRISDILNIKLKDIDWKNNKLTVIQPKTNNLNILPLSKEVGWAIIEYIKVRPKCDNEYLFIKLKYPYDKMTQFNNFNKYFDKIDMKTNEENKKGIHNLRHSLAKNMLDNDIPLPIISSTLGHSDVNTTSSTYIKIDTDKLKTCVLEVE